MRATIHFLAAVGVSCCVISVAGCAATAESASGLFAKMTGRKTAEEALDIKTPQDRVKELRELAKTAQKKSAEEKDQVTAELAEEIRNEEDPAMRRHVLRTLAEYHTPLSFSVLQAGLQDSDLEVRRVACESLGKQGGPQAAQQLAHVAGADTDPDVRIAAVRALGKTHEKAALTPLAEALTDADPAVQYRAQESLRAVSGRDFGSNVQAWREYAETGKSSAPEVSFSERMRRAMF